MNGQQLTDSGRLMSRRLHLVQRVCIWVGASRNRPATRALASAHLALSASFMAATDPNGRDGAHLAISSASSPTRFIEYGDLIYEAEVGRGAHGAVHRVKHRPSGGVYAAKVIHKSLSDLDPHAVAEFFHELALLASLHEPHIATLVGSSTNPANQPVLIIEYAEGRTLRERLFSQPRATLSAEQQKQIACDVASALSFMHCVQVPHRHLTSANVLLDRRGERAKITDVGLAKIDASATPLARRDIADLVYLAPELLDASVTHGTAAADVYAFGILLTELYTASRPFSDANVRDLASLRELVCHAVPFDSLPPSVPHLASGIIRNARQQSPAARPTMLSCLEQLRSVASGAAVPANFTGSVPPPIIASPFGPFGAASAQSVVPPQPQTVRTLWHTQAHKSHQHTLHSYLE